MNFHGISRVAVFPVLQASLMLEVPWLLYAYLLWLVSLLSDVLAVAVVFLCCPPARLFSFKTDLFKICLTVLYIFLLVRERQ
jgi:hypothetical protein